jgi:large subunit ribosomal protein L18
MAHGPRYRVHFRRRREGKTDYRSRRNMLRGDMPRAVVRHTLRYVTVQFIAYDEKGDTILATATSKELLGKDFGWKGATGNTTTAYLTGLLAGKRALSKEIEEAVLDIGMQSPAKGSSVFAALKGMVDAGVEIAYDEEALPSEERIKGAHLKTPPGAMFDQVKNKIMEAR